MNMRDSDRLLGIICEMVKNTRRLSGLFAAT